MRVVDLFSGLGGFSQAFLDRGHEVVRYDNDEQFADVPNTEIMDVLELQELDADVILAGIDCTHFTYANANPDSQGYQLAERLARHTLDLIHSAHPRYWVIENPVGSRLWNIIGGPVIKTAWGYWGTYYLKPTGLHGVLPFMEWPTRYTEPQPKESWDMEVYSRNKFCYLAPRAPELRSLIPYSFSLALCKAMEEDSAPQMTFAESVRESSGGREQQGEPVAGVNTK